MPEALENTLESEGERNAQTTSMDDIVARSRKERDAELLAEGLLSEESIDPEEGEPADIHLDSSEDEEDLELEEGENADDSELEDEEGEVEIEASENKKLDNTPDTPNNFIHTRDGKQFMRLTQNGSQVDMPLEQAVAIVQKQNNADLQTTLAHQSKNHYDTLAAEVALKSKPTSSGDGSSTAAVDPGALKEALKEMIDGDFGEGSDKVVEVITDILKSGNPQISSNDVGKIVTNVLDTRSMGGALTEFSKMPKYQALMEDKAFKSMLDAETEIVYKDPFFMQGKPSYLEIFKKAGDNVIERAENTFGVKADDTADQEDENSPDEETSFLSDEHKVARKRAHKSSVRAAGGKRGVVKDPPPKTREQVIAGMSKARGQNIYAS